MTRTPPLKWIAHSDEMSGLSVGPTDGMANTARRVGAAGVGRGQTRTQGMSVFSSSQ
jgi:hypothetical protein